MVITIVKLMVAVMIRKNINNKALLTRPVKTKMIIMIHDIINSNTIMDVGNNNVTK